MNRKNIFKVVLAIVCASACVLIAYKHYRPPLSDAQLRAIGTLENGLYPGADLSLSREAFLERYDTYSSADARGIVYKTCPFGSGFGPSAMFYSDSAFDVACMSLAMTEAQALGAYTQLLDYWRQLPYAVQSDTDFVTRVQTDKMDLLLKLTRKRIGDDRNALEVIIRPVRAVKP